MVKITPIFFYVILFLFILAFCSTATNYDYDLWARLIAGMGSVQTGHVLKQDFLSYTPTHPWFDHEWGSGVIFYLTQHFFSSAGILFLQAILIFLIFFFISRIIKLRGLKTTTEYNFLFYYFTFIPISYIVDGPIRSQMFSFLFFTVFLYILESARKGKTKLIFLLPLLMIIWNNLHGGCVSGIGLILIYLIGEFFNKKPVNQYIFALASTILVLPINPWGLSYLNFLLKAVLMPRPLISEWRWLFYKDDLFGCMKFKIYALFLISTEIAMILKQLKSKNFYFDKTKFLVLSATIFLAVLHVKFIPFAVITMACFLYDDFYTFFNSLTKNAFTNIANIANIKIIIIYGLIIIFAFSTIKMKGFGPYLDWSRYPVKAVEFLKTNNIKGKLLADFSFGSYISYKLYPNNKIYMDGRYEEVYDEYLFDILDDFDSGGQDWNIILEKFPPDIILIEKTHPARNLLDMDKQWSKIFDDNTFVIFVKSKDLNKYKHPFKKPSADIKYYKRTLFDTDINFGKTIFIK